MAPGCFSAGWIMSKGPMTTMSGEEYRTTRITSNWDGRMAFARRPDMLVRVVLDYALYALWVLAAVVAVVTLFG